MQMNAPLALLNHLSPSEFLAEYWQKKPLLIRQAIPNFKSFLTPNELAGLACEADVQSRIVQNQQQSWQVQHGPFDDESFSALPASDWTLLVQSVNHHLPEAAALSSQFNFIPYARLDDLMVSYAPTGGSVGAHMDAYDVFLLQGSGKRRWRIHTKPDTQLIDDVPIKLLKHFEAEQEWVLEAGDMLYLPPNVAHHGISESDDCMTYSIGFKVPSAQSLVHGFLEHLQDTMQMEGLYQDADLSPQQHPAEISTAMIEKSAAILQQVTWDKSTVCDFLGRYITEPKPDVIFEPVADISQASLLAQLATQSLRLDLKTQLLFHQADFYINGEVLTVPANITAHIRTLADARILDTTALTPAERVAIAAVLHPALLAGYVHCE